MRLCARPFVSLSVSPSHDMGLSPAPKLGPSILEATPSPYPFPILTLVIVNDPASAWSLKSVAGSPCCCSAST